MIAGIIDIILLIILMALNIFLSANFLSLWFVVVLIADILLVIGAIGNISGLLMTWMIIGMINIVFLFIGWLALPIYGFVAVFVTAACNSDDLWGSGESVDCGGTENLVIAGFAINMVFVIGLPIYYIYLWVVVKSHRANLNEAERNTIRPIQGSS